MRTNHKDKYALGDAYVFGLKNNFSSRLMQAFYAGGSERSGQQVLGPPPKKNPMRDYVSDVFSSAREHGAQVVDQHETATASGSSR